MKPRLTWRVSARLALVTFGVAVLCRLPMDERRGGVSSLVVHAKDRDGASQPADVTPKSFCPAYFRAGDGANGPPQLTLFPADGPEVTIPLPGLPAVFHPLAFSPDGKAIYGETFVSHPGSGVTKVELDPLRQISVLGPGEMDRIWALTVPQVAGVLFVAGWSRGGGSAECGVFQIDTGAGTIRKLRAGRSPDCSGALGPISPDGKRVVSHWGKQVGVLDLDTGARQIIEGLGGGSTSNGGSESTECSWSPDGRWISAIRDGSILLIDSSNLTRRRKLGKAGNGGVHWSPDSRFLLVAQNEISCIPTLYFQSLAVINVETGHRTKVRAAHCQIGVPYIGWIARPARK
jgi:hypothetical protein